jgi:hypothetical protein
MCRTIGRFTSSNRKHCTDQRKMDERLRELAENAPLVGIDAGIPDLSVAPPAAPANHFFLATSTP